MGLEVSFLRVLITNSICNYLGSVLHLGLVFVVCNFQGICPFLPNCWFWTQSCSYFFILLIAESVVNSISFLVLVYAFFLLILLEVYQFYWFKGLALYIIDFCIPFFPFQFHWLLLLSFPSFWLFWVYFALLFPVSWAMNWFELFSFIR